MVESKRKAQLDQRHLETYYRFHRLKDALSHQYATLLKEKVQRQRQEMNLNDPDESKVMEGHKEKKRATIQRFTRSTLTHDDTYLRALPKTRHYLVLELQRQLTRLGCLKSRKEQEVFRVWVEQHRNKYQLEKQMQAMELHSNSSPCVTLESLLKQRSGTPPKLQISPDDTTAQHKHMPVSVRGSGGGANSCQPQGKQSWGQSETELMFPEVFTREIKVPKFSSLHSTFLEKFSTSMLIVRSHEPPVKSKTTGITQHKLRLMHNLSLSHKADTQRIMAKNGLSLQITDGFSIKELVSDTQIQLL
ncbi:uncharacterized protein si:ch211-130h14.4 [Xyrauchen texanus]|uniref:uncharacterized protein si:ch211-130h14.4 n=1 Tax=Xyrauchen texanus TaxID=154827 RepID=UPI0022423FE0|nr:uncharacterized protein si:ch211-130h14.4 [Xyrauchen texanus]